MFQEIYEYFQKSNNCGGVRCSEKWLKKNKPLYYSFIKKYLKEEYPDLPFAARRVIIRRGFKKMPLCKVCGCPLINSNNYKKFSQGKNNNPSVYCSNACSGKDPEKVERIASQNRGRVGTMLGKTHTKEALKKMSEAKKGKPSNRKGIPHSAKTKKKISKKVKERYMRDPEAYAENCRKGYYKKIEQGYALTGHNYNANSLQYLEEISNWLRPFKCTFAPKEKSITIGYRKYAFVDFYCEELKIIIEWDEEYHFAQKQLLEDRKRETLIKKVLKDSSWIIFRIREKEYIKLDYENKKQYLQEVIDRRDSAE